MACPSCGGRRRSSNLTNNLTAAQRPAPKPLQSRISEMPGTKDNLVLAHYIGGQGRGMHYYRGPVTKFPYRVKFDDLLHVDPRDVSEPDAVSRSSLLVRVHKDGELPKKIVGEEQSTIIIEETTVERTPVKAVSRVPVTSEDVKATVDGKVEDDDLPDINKLSVRALKKIDLELAQVEKLLEIERAHQNRPNMIMYLESILDN